MQRFFYKARNNRGEIVTGTVRAQNEVEADKILVKHNLVSTDIVVERQKTIESLFISRISVRDRAVFSRQLSTMLSAGLPLSKAVSLLAKQSKNDRLKNIFLSIYKDLEEGYTFSSALAKHPDAFDRVFVSVVNAGESTGKLDVVLNQLAVQLENDSQFVSRIKSSLYYPAFILAVLIAAGVFMLAFVVPKLRTIFEQSKQDLPIMTKILIGLSSFLQSWWWLLLIVILALAIFIKYWLETDSGAKFFNNLQLTLPGLKNIYEGIYMYRLTRVMSMLLGAGVPLLDSLRISSSVMDSVIYEEGIAKIATGVEKGVPLSTQFLKDPFFPPFIGQMTAVGEETGELDVILAKVAEYYKQATDDLSKGISSLIEPAVLVLVGLGVAFVVFAIYLPIFQMNSTVG